MNTYIFVVSRLNNAYVYKVEAEKESEAKQLFINKACPLAKDIDYDEYCKAMHSFMEIVCAGTLADIDKI